MTTTLTDRLAWAIHRPLARVTRGLLAAQDRLAGPRCRHCRTRTRWQDTHERYDHAGDV